MSAVEVSLRFQLRVEFPDFVLDVGEDVPQTGVTAIVGPSGSGKSTLLRAIAGFERPVSGTLRSGDEVWFDSARGIDLPAHRRPVGMLFQDARLFGHLNVEGNLRFAEKRAPADPLRFDRDEILSALDVAPLLTRRVDGLSGGEQKRVALARTLLAQPQLLLLDEPLSGLDRERKAEILPYLETLTRRFDLPTLFVSHDLDEVAALSDHVWLLEGGRLQDSGETRRVFDRLDVETRVGRFEAGVLLDGVVQRHDPRLRVTTVDLHGDEVVMPLVERFAPGARVRMRVRSRDVAIATERPTGLSIRNILPGTILGLETDEAGGAVEVLIALREDRIKARLSLAAVEALSLGEGMSVFALVKSVTFEAGR